TFVSGVALPTSYMPGSVAASDLNADGKADLVVVSDGQLAVYLGTGAGSFGADQGFLMGPVLAQVAIRDLDGDGRLDLVTADSYANTITFRLGLGDGTFGQRSGLGAGRFLSGVAVADFDSDGQPDLAVTATADDQVVLLLNNGHAVSVPEVPAELLVVSAAAPNPMHDDASVALVLAARARVEVGVFDAAGRSVRRLVHGTLEAGLHRFTWDARRGDAVMV